MAKKKDYNNYENKILFNKTKIFLKILKILIKDPKSLNKVIMGNDILWKDYVIKKYFLESGLPTIDILYLFPNFEEIINPYSFLQGTSLPTDIGLLKALSRRYDNCRYLEIGSWRGESLANIAQMAKECISIDLSEKEMKQQGLSDKFISNFLENRRFFSKKFKNIECINQNSTNIDFSKLGKLDLIYIDGDHTYNMVKIDTQNAFKVLRDKKSVIVWHDYGRSPENVIRWDVLAGILDGCPKEKIKNLYCVSNTLCAIYIDSSIQIDSQYTNTNFSQIPNKNFTVKLSANYLNK